MDEMKFYWVVEDGFTLFNIGPVENVGTVANALKLANEFKFGDVAWDVANIEIRDENGDRDENGEIENEI